MKFILTISALDPGGGAGVSADVKAAKSLAFHPCSIITALTVQNSSKLYSVHPVDAEIVKDQLNALSSEFEFSTVKIGVVPSLEIAEVIAKFLSKLKCPKVLDPVIEAGVGGRLGKKEAYEILMREVTVATPNYTEATVFGGNKDAELLAIDLFNRFGCDVVITGGELKGRDVVCEKGRIYSVEAELIPGNFHGTGCVYSTALACYLTNNSMEDAVRKARIFVLESVKRGFKVLNRVYVNP